MTPPTNRTTPKNGQVVLDGDVADLIRGVLFPPDRPGLPLQLNTSDIDGADEMVALLKRARTQLDAT